jgi:hypothetical protein
MFFAEVGVVFGGGLPPDCWSMPVLKHRSASIFSSRRVAKFAVGAALLLLSMLGIPPADSARANTLNVFANGPAPGLDIDLTVSVSGGGIASFLFQNNSTGGAAGSAVHEIYFESGLASLLQTPGMACTRFRRHRVRCFNGTGGWSWRDGNLHANTSLRL